MQPSITFMLTRRATGRWGPSSNKSRLFPSSIASRPALGPTQPPLHRAPRGLFPQRQRRGDVKLTDPSPLSSAGAKSYVPTSTPFTCSISTVATTMYQCSKTSTQNSSTPCYKLRCNGEHTHKCRWWCEPRIHRCQNNVFGIRMFVILFLGTFAKLRKATISFMSVCPH